MTNKQNPLKIDIWYFSATGNTKAIARVLQEEFSILGADTNLIDITPLDSRNPGILPGTGDVIVLGLPVHSWRAPRVIREWLVTLKGQGKKCAMFFTYGGFGIHPSHYSTRKILEQQGFSVVGSAEFPASHTFNLGGWNALKNRPDRSDFDVAREYAAAVLRRFTGEDPGFPPEMEPTTHPESILDSIEQFRFKILTKLPSRDGTCSNCGICADVCPTGSMDAIAGKANRDTCIACLACVVSCPEQTITINDMTESWAYKLTVEQISEAAMQEKKSKIYL
ncbi:EFR1 family ferrodoxin [Methanospirillum stamsii]|uniref:4Fe-4S ferredoxin n=1 Tax=Methanospirillum stamsii TaxID=1277351 RepID=A0A2V2N6N5_9EURY|nr:EFR1 family ferrodoxin [Methanospirillum stamsii]PWR71181.1 4Fe-4S ferredoxin [Methanospirillum stamsii]